MIRRFSISFTCLLLVACGPQSHVPENLQEAGETVWIEGGRFEMGHLGQADAQPIITQEIEGFEIQRYEVTNTQFEAFVKETGYLTLAEKLGGSYVFSSSMQVVESSLPGAPWWKYTEGANWQHPQGKNSTIHTKSWNPVSHIAYIDACTYCDWLGMRLPTETEREYVAQKGKPARKMNVWQGTFPVQDKKSDGFDRTAPVGSFRPDENGLYDLRGNVWEWCADSYHAYAYRMAGQLPLQQRTQGPDKAYDPSAPYESSHVIRGGSFLCSENYCTGYLPYTRMRSSDSLTFEHIGFRCVRSRK